MITLRIITSALILHTATSAFLSPTTPTSCNPNTALPSTTTDIQTTTTPTTPPPSRRSFLQSSTTLLTLLTTTTTTLPSPASAAEEKRTMQQPLYPILRVREAAEQEARLIKSGKFKDVQRANVKLAVKFMLENYRLNDNFIAASAFLTGSGRIRAIDAGQNTVQNLLTILEYFDSSDVQNLKVGSNSLGGQKETIVLNGLDATRKGIDEFLSFFPRDEVGEVVARINAENEMNLKEFDPELGQLLNPTPQK
eukprot:CAMPEP_0198250804 /NCGR_PEP_ID=MMETSP1447-20131203/1850_1 /TAXON_ID=420782 /ORGANISM="Chaetoceros dichaeta, Strain CCMP1751" /LENGTH=251 /DNA_ID=CAMNT_0043935689 /DNA_START=11 /DNA_END=766 /DNA_ORIENTATION=-